MGGLERGGEKVNIITPHSLFSLTWDEWASIFAILTAIVLILKWLIGKANKELFGPIYQQLQIVNDNFDKFDNRQTKSELRLQEGDKKFIHHDGQLKDHERRITHLEEERHNEVNH